MSTSQYHSMDRGAVYRAPTMQVYHSRVITTTRDGNVRTGWFGNDNGLDWVPLRLQWAVNGEDSTLTLRRHLATASAAGVRRVEDIIVSDGDLMRLVQFCPGGSAARGRMLEWFRGYVARRRTVIEPDFEGLIVTAYGPEIRLRGVVVSGMWHKKASADDSEMSGTLSPDQACRANVFRSDLPVVFNKSGMANASRSLWRLGDDILSSQDRQCRVFESPRREVFDNGSATVQAQYWTAWTALRSLVDMFDNYDVISPHTPWDQIAKLLGDTPIGEVDVEGMNLLEAIKAVLMPVGFGFALEPWTAGNGGDKWGRARHRLIVFALRDPAAVRHPRLAPNYHGNVSIDSAEGRFAEVQRLRFVRDSHRVANDVTVLGEQKRVQVVLEFNDSAANRDLHPMWNTSLHETADWADNNVVDPWRWPDGGDGFQSFAEKYNRGGKDHWKYRHVFRSFAWNEDGALKSVISRTPDLSSYGIGDSGLYVRRPRPVASMLAYDPQGQRVRLHPRMVQLGIVGDDTSWIDVPAEIWNDRAGFTICANQLAGPTGDGQWYPYAPHRQHSATYRGLHYLTLLHNALRGGGDYRLRLRLIGSIECDQAVRGTAPRDMESTWPMRSQKVIRLGGRLQWRQVEDAPLGGDTQYACVDDSAAADEYARAVRKSEQDGAARGSIILRYLTRSYKPGDGIGGTSGRGINLKLGGSGRRGAPVVVGVVWDFENEANKTELLLDRGA